ncbi:LysR family transcriptional regulator [Pseudoalteromonas rubra]|uniref:LysR family transcriptional regulator n=1 Tax=Pseudoalteromonas rubra TaxID=43658 RepID=A0A5S3WRQ0_9GAMM|nr:LysR family transcriptional regulator [Pseudoalteromonas rubra]TMP30786.1 LysR family transcriptional regulator [Pseudoalteromonas rubra]TMP34154.1 LysR family transcriptional regulator [Pseudoalteromonas rubra]
MITINHNSLKLLAIFATVIDSGSFAAAARRLHSSRSRISEQVSQLESQLNVRLLQRSTRQLKLTQEGEKVLQHARQLTGILQHIEAQLTDPEPSGRVTLTMNHDIAHKFILPKLDKLAQRYPQISLDLIVDDDPLDLIEQQIDLAIRIGFVRDESLVARLLHQERFVLFASPTLLAQHGIPNTLSELEAMPWLELKQTAEQGTQLLYRNDEPVIIHPQRYHSCNSPYLLQQMVASGLGVATLLPSTVQQEVEQGTLIRIFEQLQSEPLVFSLVYPSRRQVPQRTRAVIDFLLSESLFTS